MATKKNETKENQNLAATAVEGAETQTAPVVDPAPEEKESDKAKGKTETVKETEIPARVKEVLKIFSNYDELYVDDNGGVFTKDTDPNCMGSAELYKNPYFKH